MKLSTAHFVSGLLGAIATALFITIFVGNSFFYIEVCDFFYNEYGASSPYAYVQLESTAILIIIYAFSFFVLLNDRWNARMAMFGVVTCMIHGALVQLFTIVAVNHWSLQVLCFLFFPLGYFFAFSFLKTSVPRGVWIATIIAMVVYALLGIGREFLASTATGSPKEILKYCNTLSRLQILCLIVLLAHYVLQIVTSRRIENDRRCLIGRHRG